MSTNGKCKARGGGYSQYRCRGDQTYFLGLKILHPWFFSGSRNLSRISFFLVGDFDARMFFGCRISGLCIFLGSQYEAPSDPFPVMYTASAPLGCKDSKLVYLNSTIQRFFSNRGRKMLTC